MILMPTLYHSFHIVSVMEKKYPITIVIWCLMGLLYDVLTVNVPLKKYHSKQNLKRKPSKIILENEYGRSV